MTSREILASQRILKPAVSTVASSVERTGIEPVTSGLQKRSNNSLAKAELPRTSSKSPTFE
jgi:hypothetical protein